MTAAFSSHARATAFAIFASAFAAPAFAAYDCAPEQVPASIIVATPEMRLPVNFSGSCQPINALAFVDRRRAADQQQAQGLPADGMSGRFYMTQNGRRMTADDFDAWMQAKGIRVAKGKQAAPTPAPAPASEDATGR